LINNFSIKIIRFCILIDWYVSQNYHIAMVVKYIILEKIITNNYQDGLEIFKMCDNSNILLFLVTQYCMNGI
jgi:hypothetical protein